MNSVFDKFIKDQDEIQTTQFDSVDSSFAKLDSHYSSFDQHF